MFVSVRRYKVTGSVTELARRIEESFVPLLKRSPGFKGYYMVDARDGTMATISIFSTRAMAEESNDAAAEWVKENAKEFHPDAPEITAGEVKVLARP